MLGGGGGSKLYRHVFVMVIFDKGDFFDFLFAFLRTRSLMKKGTLPLGANSFL